MMPNAKVLEEKKAVVASLVEKIKNSPAGVLVDYKGINVEDDTKLRKQLREAGVEYAVIKNTLIRFAAKGTAFEALEPNLEGPTALAVSKTDATAPARILAEFAKKADKLEIKGGLMEGKAVSAAEVEAIASLPSRDELLAPIAAAINGVAKGNAEGLLKGVDELSQLQHGESLDFFDHSGNFFASHL